MKTEIWKTVPDYNRYEVSTWGRVRNAGTGFVLNPPLSTGGRRFVRLYPDDKTQRVYNYYIHKMVIETFLGPSPAEGLEVGHLDSDFENNHLTNLVYETHESNMRRFHLNGGKFRVISKAMKAAVHMLHQQGKSTNAIQVQLGLSRCTVIRLVGGSGDVSKKLTKNQVATIRTHLKSGDSMESIGRTFSVTATNIKLIRDGKIWVNA